MTEGSGGQNEEQAAAQNKAGSRLQSFIRRLKPTPPPAKATPEAAFLGDFIAKTGLPFEPVSEERWEEMDLEYYPISLKDRGRGYEREEKSTVNERCRQRLQKENFGAADFHDTLVDLALLTGKSGGASEEHVRFNGLVDEERGLRIDFGQKKINEETISLLAARPTVFDRDDNGYPRVESIRWKDGEPPILKAELVDRLDDETTYQSRIFGKEVISEKERKNSFLLWVKKGIEPKDVQKVCERVLTLATQPPPVNVSV